MQLADGQIIRLQFRKNPNGGDVKVMIESPKTVMIRRMYAEDLPMPDWSA